ncbi:flagellar hook-associated protein 2 [Chungangia koreensis]|uniref:Flagellar hook-associated protein 2 n=1 Tax=Chungangia koreensis TaxID=752657 RepID=A0ABV8X1E2_9LACT
MAGLRVGGLASGMDIDSIVAELMKAERIPLDKLFQKKTTYEWQRDAFRSINTKLNTFNTYLFENFSLTSNFNKKTVSNSNESILTATATSAASGSLTVQSVDSLATSSYGAGTITDSTKRASTTTLSSLGVTGFAADGTLSVSLSVLQADGTMKATSVVLNSSDKLTDVVSKFNNSGAGVTAFYDEKSGQFSISAKASGDNVNGAEIINNTTSTDLFTKLGFGKNDLATNGSNSVSIINGARIERTSNNFTIAGFNITLKNKTVAGAAPITLSATTDIDSMVDKVKEFVGKYNELVSGMNDQLKEKKYRDYPPLTDQQREDMSEHEQELWDEKAKSGLLRNDPIISGGLSNMRNAIYGTVGSEVNIVNTLAEMGITTSKVYSDGGKLVIDEDKLRKALTENPDQVVKTISQTGAINKTTGEDTRGIVQRLRDSMKDFTKSIERQAGKASSTDQQYNIGKRLIDTNGRIFDFQRRLEDIESRYWRQFTAMEKAISRANQQSAMLMGATQG